MFIERGGMIPPSVRRATPTRLGDSFKFHLHTLSRRCSPKYPQRKLGDWSLAIFEPQRGFVVQPRVAVLGYPGKRTTRAAQPQRGCCLPAGGGGKGNRSLPPPTRAKPQPRWGWPRRSSLSQGCRTRLPWETFDAPCPTPTGLWLLAGWEETRPISFPPFAHAVRNPVGVGRRPSSDSQGSRVQQPWAERRNPFGVQKWPNSSSRAEPLEAA